MHTLHKFLSPRAMAVTMDAYGENLPFELGPWKSLGVAPFIQGKDTAIVDDVLSHGYRITARDAIERYPF